MKLLTALLLTVTLAACATTDQPAAPNRMGRFLGLVASCGCSNISPERMVAEYPLALGGHYSGAEIAAMKGYVELGANEQWDNQGSICAGICSHRCMVNAVAAPLGGRVTPGIEPCLVSEGGLDLEEPKEATQQ